MRRTISISTEVWNEIAKRGRFGETPDDVLRRVFKLEKKRGPDGGTVPAGFRTRTCVASRPLSAKVEKGVLRLAFADGPSYRWLLASRADKDIIRQVRRDAVAWAEENGATNPGQTNAVKKALTDARYYLTK